MQQRPYPKIAGPGEQQGRPSRGGTWVALEKIHGANVVVGVNAREVRFGKRKGWLEPDAAFFGWQLLRAELAAAAREVFNQVGGAEVHLYGELFGGAYPHALVPAVPGASPVQTGIWYAPDVRWAVFDVLRIAQADDEGELLAHHDVVRLAQAAGLLTPPVLCTGSRQDVERVETRFLTRVPAQLGLPPIDDNLAEGVVLKPDVASAPAARPMRKRKILELDERRFDEATPFDRGQRLRVAELVLLAVRLVNAPRIASARSKVGEGAEEIVDEVVVDVLIDLGEAHPVAVRQLGADDEEVVAKAIRSATHRELATRSGSRSR